ncbi:hypothetical protein [Streptomyces tremellae]|uniref:NADP-dependent oxidoreductase domain-containing protein n=1 Tax=Streptomyces tremellae TaxID=1124239 RepID=A0ABP7FL78_9ACTN
MGPRSAAHLEANLAGLDVRLTEQQRAAPDEVSAPALNFPAGLNRQVGPMLQFAGATVDGQRTAVCPPLERSAVRY